MESSTYYLVILFLHANWYNDCLFFLVRPTSEFPHPLSRVKQPAAYRVRYQPHHFVLCSKHIYLNLVDSTILRYSTGLWDILEITMHLISVRMHWCMNFCMLTSLSNCNMIVCWIHHGFMPYRRKLYLLLSFISLEFSRQIWPTFYAFDFLALSQFCSFHIKLWTWWFGLEYGIL